MRNDSAFLCEAETGV